MTRTKTLTTTSDLCREVEMEACKLLEGETQRKILDVLRAKDLTVGKIAKKLNMAPQSIYHHIKKLETAGLIRVTREKRCGHLIESYYQTTADNFVYSTENSTEKAIKEDSTEILDKLNKIGFKMDTSEETASKLAEIQLKRRKFAKLRSPVPEICSKCGSTDFFVKAGPMDPVKLDYAYHYANLMLMTDDEYEARINLEKELRQFLLSICQEKPKA
ncbi:MAG: winged helix-turn-helix domain-containing protein [Candidatus Bathyarchaeota archaeon]|nr:winged helix-turn-helix domain-containing protein [Candidatus Bathyarchaeota archaeon]